MPYRTADDRIDGVNISFADVTGVKQGAESLRRLAAVLIDSNDAVITCDFDGCVRSWNRGAEQIYGYSEAEALGMNIVQLSPEENHDEPRNLIARARAGEIMPPMETKQVRKDGDEIDVGLTISTLRDEAGAPAAVIATGRDITQRKWAEKTLLDREETTRKQFAEIEAIYSAAPVGLASLDADMRFVRVNARFAQMTGRPIPQHPGRSPRQIMPALADVFEVVSRRVIKTGEPVMDVEMQVELGGESADARVWLYSCFPVNHGGGRVWGVSAAVQDVTDRYLMETEIRGMNEQLGGRVAERTAELEQTNRSLQEEVVQRKRAQESGERLAAIVESSDDAIIGTTLDGAVTSWNAAAERMYGYSAQEMIGKSDFTLIPVGEQDEVERIHERVRRGQYVEHVEVRRSRKNGQEIIVSLTNSPVRNHSGAIVGVSAISRDITRQKRLEEALRGSQSRLAAIVDTAGDGLITIDERGIVDSFNGMAEKLFGYAAEEVIGQNINMLMPPPYRDGHDDYLANYRATGVKRIIGIGREVVARRKDGSKFPIDLAVSEFNDGTRRLFTGLIRDISKRKTLEKEVLEVAAQEQRRIGQDLHDSVGQELTGLGLVAETLADTLSNQEHPDATLATKIADGTRRVLSEVRALSRGLIPVEVDAAGLPTALVDLAARVRDQSKVECVFHCDESFRCDDNILATHFYRIAQEAVTNGLKHGRPKNIEIRLEHSNGQMILRVWNDGAPITNLDAANEGMGLKIMRYRAGLIDAILQIESAELGGTLLTCTLIKERNHEQHGRDEETRAHSDR